MTKKIVATEKAPGAIGPYSQGIIAGQMVYTSGQLPIDMTKGTMPDHIKEQTYASLSNVKAIIEEAGASMKDVVKVLVFLKDMNDFAEMNEVYGSFFTENQPARSCVEVARLPKDALIEIEAIALLNH